VSTVEDVVSRDLWYGLCWVSLFSGAFSRAAGFDQPAEYIPAGDSGIVVAYHPAAREIGERILQAGGNAADAFVATTVAENVLAEGASSLAGPLGVLIYCTGSCRERHPQDPAVVYLDADFNHPISPEQRWKPGVRHRGTAVLVPGAPLGLWEIVAKYGSMSFSTLVQPAIALAEEGFPVNNFLAGFLKWRKSVLRGTEYGKRTFFRDRKPLHAGEILRQPEVAAFLRRFAAEGPDYVYRGAWAGRFLKSVRAAGGFLGPDDLTGYAVHWTPPWIARYRGSTLYTASGSSFGGIWVLLALKAWEHARIDAGARYWSDPEMLEMMMRTARQVWSESYLLDPKSLANREFITSRLADEYGVDIWERVRNRAPARPMGVGGLHSYHIIARDKEGSIFSGTTTIESAPWGDGIFVEGIPLTTAGAIPWGKTPGARRISPLTAQFAFRDGEPQFVVGTISNSLLEAAFQILVNLIDYEMPPAEAVSTPRFGTFPTGGAWRGRPLLLDRNWLDPRVSKSIVNALKNNGIRVTQSGIVDTGLGAVLSRTGSANEGATVPIPYVSRPFEVGR